MEDHSTWIRRFPKMGLSRYRLFLMFHEIMVDFTWQKIWTMGEKQLILVIVGEHTLWLFFT